ncbi:MAG TPA: CRTAC1 family protein [Candidatus Polarisedimenticolia bacterium]|nr:CRTAC1 family protein [Candidatus Polarisedimenticolia bacterium]
MRKFPGLMLIAALVACRGSAEPPSPPATPSSDSATTVPAAPDTPPTVRGEVRFEERARAAGIDFIHVNGAFGKKWLPETMGSGAVFLDYDGDGDQDLFLANGRSWPGRIAAGRAGGALYQNDGKGSFRDVTRRAGLALELYGMGAAAGDVDNDGDVDLYLTGLGSAHLLLNNGDGTFRDATASFGVGDPGWSTSAAFLDFDHDGDLDLFVCNYVAWTPETDLFCTLDGKKKSYCTPESYRGLTSRLYRNEAGKRFTDVSDAAGIAKGGGKSLGVATLDYDEDGWMDLAVANDTQPNQLFRNRGDGTFEEKGVETGMAYSESGVARGAMGIDAGDYLNRGPESLLIGNFSNQMLALYHNSGKVFIDKAPASALGPTSLLFLAFGLFFFDYDLDGYADILVANGHVEDEIQAVQERVSYEERPLLYRNLGDGNFEEVGMSSGPDMAKPVVGRGAAYADVDGDGDLDFIISVNHGAPRLLINRLPAQQRHAIRLTAEGVTGNRSAIGARFRLRAQGKEQRRWVKSGSSYCSQSELPITFGLGAATAADEVEVTWPGGKQEALGRLEAGRAYVVREGKGIVDSRPLAGLD